jgi:nucleoside-diphosphate-sugar epimerase
MKAIVTGASGFVGSRLVSELIKSGYEVVAIGRRKIQLLSNYRRQLLTNAIYLDCDLNNLDYLTKTLLNLNFFSKDLDFVFHLAWGGNIGLSDMDVGSQSQNIECTLNSFKLATKLKAKRYIFCGTMEEFFAERYTNLDHKIDTLFNRHVIYALTKISARQALKLLYKKKDPEILFVTSSHVMGPGDDRDSFLQIALTNILKGKNIKMSSGKQNFDVINVIDCAKAFLLVGKYGTFGSSYWIGSGKPRKLKFYIQEMNKIFSRVKIHYGAIPYNDVILDKKIFSTKKLFKDTKFKPSFSFSDTVQQVAEYLQNKD